DGTSKDACVTVKHRFRESVVVRTGQRQRRAHERPDPSTRCRRLPLVHPTYGCHRHAKWGRKAVSNRFRGQEEGGARTDRRWVVSRLGATGPARSHATSTRPAASRTATTEAASYRTKSRSTSWPKNESTW